MQGVQWCIFTVPALRELPDGEQEVGPSRGDCKMSQRHSARTLGRASGRTTERTSLSLREGLRPGGFSWRWWGLAGAWTSWFQTEQTAWRNSRCEQRTRSQWVLHGNMEAASWPDWSGGSGGAGTRGGALRGGEERNWTFSVTAKKLIWVPPDLYTPLKAEFGLALDALLECSRSGHALGPSLTAVQIEQG